MNKSKCVLTMVAAVLCVYMSVSPDMKAETREPGDSTAVSVTNRTDAGAALQGRYSGLLVTNPSGAPGETARLQIRGLTGADNVGPLLIVDGLKVENIQHLDPSMIENVEVLKDAAATALYGIQGGNGVICITTRKGEGRFSVGYDFRLTSASLGRKAEVLSAEEWMERYGITGYDGTGTDWLDVVYGNGLAHQHGLSLQGGNEKGGFFTTVNYLDDDGIVNGSSDTHRRLATRLNGRYEFTDWLEIGVNASFTTQSIRYLAQQQKWFSMFAETLTHDPLTEPYFKDPGEFPDDMFLEYTNGGNILKDPSNGMYYAISRYTDSVNPLIYRDRSHSIVGYEDIYAIAYARFSPFKGFTVTGRFGYKTEQRDRSADSVPFYADDRWKSDYYTCSVTEISRSGYQADVIADYMVTKARHTIDAKAGLYYESMMTDTRTGSGQSATTAIDFDDIDFTTTANGFSDLAAYARMGYDFDKRYMVQASFRADRYRSDRLLTKEDEWYFFPTVSFGWTISNESFFSDNICLDAVSLLALKASWGKGGSTSGYEAFSNPHLGTYIETSEHLDIGLSAAFFRNRLNLSADWYEKVTGDIVANAGSDSATSIRYAILSSVRNSGLEIDMSWEDRAGEFTYRVSGNLSTLKNEVLSFGDAQNTIIRILGESDSQEVNTAYEAGKPIWYFYGYPADVSYEDMSTLEKRYIGKGIPSLYYGTEISLAYKGFDLNISGYGTSGNDIANCLFERIHLEYDELKNQSAGTVFDGSFFRIRQLQLGYTIPAQLTRKIFIRNARIFASLDDWFTFSTYPGGDPETATTGSVLSGNGTRLGMDYGSYPMSKKIVFGLSVRF